MSWFMEGDRNTKFFHSYVKGRRKRLCIQNIEDKQGRMLESEMDIGEEAVRIFQQQFTEENHKPDFDMLNNIPMVLTYEDRAEMETWPDEEEVRGWSLNLTRTVLVDRMVFLRNSIKLAGIPLKRRYSMWHAVSYVGLKYLDISLTPHWY